MVAESIPEPTTDTVRRGAPTWPPTPTALADIVVTTSDGASSRLSTLWQDRPLVLVFLPPWASPFCTDNAAQLRDNADLFDDAGVAVTAVCDVEPQGAAAFGHANNFDFRLLADPSGALREAFGVEAHASPIAGGCATFIMDTTGAIRYEHRGVEPDDYPSIWELVGQACKITGAKVEQPPQPPRAALRPSLAGPKPDGAPIIGNGNLRMLKTGFQCGKCGFAEYDVLTVSTASGILSRLFNYQHRKFSAVTCRRCTYTELYKTDASSIANVFDLLVGR